MTTKIAVSLPDAQVVAAKAAVARGEAASVSALLSEALADRLEHDSLAVLVADLVSEHGSPSKADYDWARAALGL